MIVLGGLTGFVTAATAVTLVVLVNGGGGASIGAGVMVAGFDGLPFGAMLGAMAHLLRHPED